MCNINRSSSWSYKDSVTSLQDSVTLLHDFDKSPPQLCSIAHNLKYLPFLQKELQSLQYFGCEEIEYDLLHWLQTNRKKLIGIITTNYRTLIHITSVNVSRIFWESKNNKESSLTMFLAFRNSLTYLSFYTKHQICFLLLD